MVVPSGQGQGGEGKAKRAGCLERPINISKEIQPE